MIKKKVCKRCKGTGLNYEKQKNVDGIDCWGLFPHNSTDAKGTICKSCNGTGYKER